MVVNERRRRVGSGVEFEEPRAASGFFCFIDVAGQDLLLDTRRIAGRCFPPVRHVKFDKLHVRLVERHLSNPASNRGAQPATGSTATRYLWRMVRRSTGSSNSISNLSAGRISPLTASVPQYIAVPGLTPP